MHFLRTKLELDAVGLDLGHDVDAPIAGGLGSGDVVLHRAGDDGIDVAQIVEAAIDVELVVDNDAHSIQVVEIRNFDTLALRLFEGTGLGLYAAVHRGVLDSVVLEVLGNRGGLARKPAAARLRGVGGRTRKACDRPHLLPVESAQGECQGHEDKRKEGKASVI